MLAKRRLGLSAALTVMGVLAGCGSIGQQVPAASDSAVTALEVRSTVAAPAASQLAEAVLPAQTPAATLGTSDATTAVSQTVGPGAPQASTVPTAPKFTFAFAGDVNFAERTADRLADDPDTAFGAAAAGLAAADLTMVNLETAITTGGAPEDKSFTFRAPPSALIALRSAGIDLATMANNHAADYGAVGLQDSLSAIADSGFPVIGFGADEQQAYAPFTATVNGLRVAVFAATQVHDHTLAYFAAGPGSAGVASADSDLLVQGVRAAAADYDVVVVYLHWGTEYESCPNREQQNLAAALADAGATAVVGTHAHVLQGAGWRPDGVYVAYGLSNYLWWRSFGNEQDDNGVLTLTMERHAVTAAVFVPSHLDETGVPVPATGETKDRIDAEWEDVRDCAGLLVQPPG